MHVGVVGGGVTGLVIARQLARRGHAVTLLTDGPVGGLAGGFSYPGCPGVYLERFYHHVFTSDAAIRDLVRQHGLDDDLLWLPSKSGLIAKGRLWPLGGPLDLLRFSPLGSLWQRLRMGWNLWYFKHSTDWRPLDTIRCREFFERRGNLAGYRNLWEPLLKQKFADAYDDVPAAFLWGRIHPRARSRQKGRERLGYLKGGFQRLFLKIAEAVRADGGEVRTESPVGRLCPGDRPEVVCSAGTNARSDPIDRVQPVEHPMHAVTATTFRFDRVVWTASLGRLVRTVPDPPAELVRRAEAVQSIAVTELILVMKRPATDFYWLNSLDPEITFGAVIEHTNLVPPESYGGEHILYVVNYHRPGDRRFAGHSAETLLEYHLPSLERTLPGFRRQDVLRLYLMRAGHSSPLYDLGFAARMPPHHGWLANVDVCNMSQLYPYDRNMSHCVANALCYVEEVFGGGG
jgi:protoporphyrinogen oxidase